MSNSSTGLVMGGDPSPCIGSIAVTPDTHDLGKTIDQSFKAVREAAQAKSVAIEMKADSAISPRAGARLPEIRRDQGSHLRSRPEPGLRGAGSALRRGDRPGPGL